MSADAEVYVEVSLIDGEEPVESAFTRDGLDAAGVDVADLMPVLVAALQPFAVLLQPGHGVAVFIRDNGNADIIGIAKDRAPRVAS